MAMTKITVELPLELLEKARRITGEGITGTIRHGLELVVGAPAQDPLKALGGTVRLSIDTASSRDED